MRLVQLNIWGGKLQYQIPSFLSHEQPDVVCMQEVHDLKGPSGAVFATLDELKEACNFKYSFMSPTYSSTYQQRPNFFGNAILTNLPVKQKETIFTYGKYKTNFDLTKDDFNTRNFQHVVLEVSGQDMHVLNHHGYLIEGTKEGNHETLRQMEIIIEYIRKLKGPVILAGDFNLSPDSKSIKLLSEALVNLPVKNGIESTYSQFNSNNTICDYIFVNNGVQVQSFRMSDELVSDHKALILDFEL